MRVRDFRDIAPFTSLTRHERAAVAASAQVHTYRHGERIFHGGDVCTVVTILLDGFVRLFRTNPDGAETTTAIVPPGSIVATAMLRGSTRYDAHADAIGRVRTIDIPGDIFLTLVRQSPRLCEAVAWGLITRTDDTFINTTTAVQGELWLRILHTLREVARPIHLANDDGAMLRLVYHLSHAEIAQLVGAHRSSVTRALRLLNNRGLVRLEHGHVTGVRSETFGGQAALEEVHRRMVLGR